MGDFIVRFCIKKFVPALAIAGMLAFQPVNAAVVQDAARTANAAVIQEDDHAAYRGYVWRLDEADKDGLPRNFRTTNSAFGKADAKFSLDENYVPSRKGLEQLKASGSAEFSEKEFATVMKELKKQTSGPTYILDLRQESHGFFNGDAVSWYGKRNWGNVGRSQEEALQDEKHRLKMAQGKNIETARLNKQKEESDIKKELAVKTMSEEELVSAAGVHYVRIASTDHVWPDADAIDTFITFYKQLPEDAWLHFHCAAGSGRTTTYMAIYDMMRNPDVSLKDILYRQYLLGGTYIAYMPKDDQSWRTQYYDEKAVQIKRFYDYVQANHANGFQTSWSAWLAQVNEAK